jgi:ankyrin repeat protein
MNDQDFINYQQGFLPVAAQIDEDLENGGVRDNGNDMDGAAGRGANVLRQVVDGGEEPVVAVVQRIPEAAVVGDDGDDEAAPLQAHVVPHVQQRHFDPLDDLDPFDDPDDYDIHEGQGLEEMIRREEQWRRISQARRAAARATAHQLIDDVNDDDHDHDNDGLNDEVVVPVELLPDQEVLQGLDATVSSYLFDLIREDRTCTDILSGWSTRDQGCTGVVHHCHEHPEESFYVSLQGRNPIQEACLRNACRHVVQALLTANSLGALDRDNRGNTALHLLFMDYSSGMRSQRICPHDIDEIVGDLLAINPAMMASLTNMQGNTALHLACMAPETMVDPNSIMQLLSANPTCASVTNLTHQTPLRLHCQRRNASSHVAKLLLDAHPDALSVMDWEDGWAPIHYAAANANFELLRYLVTAYPEAAKVTTSKNESALHLLCRQHSHFSAVPVQGNNGNNVANERNTIVGIVELLLEANPDAVLQRDSVHLHTPLHLVCKQGDSPVLSEVVALLLQSKPEVASMKDGENYLPLHHACEIGCRPEIVKYLLDIDPTAAVTMTRKHDSALSLACSCNKNVETVKLLIKANPNALSQKNDYGFAPLHCVCRAYQPRMGIVEALLDANPSCVHLKTNAGETPVHLLSSNSGAFVGILQMLTATQNGVEPTCTALIEACPGAGTGPQEHRAPNSLSEQPSGKTAATTNKIGNTPLHDACFRCSPFEHIETLAMANPGWLSIRNNAGHTALQILCKSGRLDRRIISTFAQVGGPEIFSVIDDNRFTPLHSAIREDTDVATLKSLIHVFPDALRYKTIYGDTPLHLACFRKAGPDIVRELAMGSSSGDASLVLETNLANQTPIGVAIDEYRSFCSSTEPCCVSASYSADQDRAFQVLANLVKILHYGPLKYQIHDTKKLNLLHASVTLHRQGVRLDPAFIRRVVRMYPEETRITDGEGNYPLHIEAGIPIEKMSLLNGRGRCCEGRCHERAGILQLLLDMYPDAAMHRNKHNHFPLGLMITSGRQWGRSNSIPLALRAFPPALHWYKGLDKKILPSVLERVDRECGTDTLYKVLHSRPELLEERS